MRKNDHVSREEFERHMTALKNKAVAEGNTPADFELASALTCAAALTLSVLSLIGASPLQSTETMIDTFLWTMREHKQRVAENTSGTGPIPDPAQVSSV